ncbi:hypothetical protein [Brachybacterium hainanense]|uniref:Integrase n=1 Tax=Brachybacterium hainanense TaxID=1541174 RepID=A0ABV6R9A1_9MICO
MTATIETRTWINPLTGREELDGYYITWTEEGVTRTTGMARREDAENFVAGLELGLTATEAGRYNRHGADAASDAQKALIVKLERQHGIPQNLEGSVAIPPLHRMTKSDASWYIDQLKRNA